MFPIEKNNNNEASPLGVAIGRALSNLCTRDPFGLIHHSACMRQPSHVLYGHQHVAWILQDLHGLIVTNAPETTSIDLQNLIPYLQRWKKRETLDRALNTPDETKLNECNNARHRSAEPTQNRNLFERADSKITHRNFN